MKKYLFLIFLSASAAWACPLKKDEEALFFPTFGYLTEDGQSWRVRVHGWVFEPEKNSLARRGLLKLLQRQIPLPPEEADSPVFRERARMFLVDNERGKEIPIRVGQQTYFLKASEDNGHVEEEILVPVQVQGPPGPAPGPVPARQWLRLETIPCQEDPRTFSGTVRLVEKEGLSVISDIDDTVKVSEVRDRKALVANTFLKEFRAVEGMAEVYRVWESAGAAFHYVSASPWQLYPPLSRFLETQGFPSGPLHLKHFRWKDRTFLDLFSSPEQYKPRVIEDILARFPRRRFILVGDSGEKDPEIYGDIARKHPQQIQSILIRDVAPYQDNAERFQKAFQGLPDTLWRIFRDAKEIRP